jgi:hypothetical protein
MREMITTFKILVAKPEGMRLLGRPKRRWKDNIITELPKVGFSGWLFERGNEPSGSIRTRVAYVLSD